MSLVIDSSYLVALYNVKDVHHASALSLAKEIASENLILFINDYVFSETITVLQRRVSSDFAIQVGNLLLESKEIERVLESTIFSLSYEKFKKFASKGISFVDASLLATKEYCSADKILTYDKALLEIVS